MYPLAPEMRRVWRPIFLEEMAKLGFEWWGDGRFIQEYAPGIYGCIRPGDQPGFGAVPFGLAPDAGIYHLRLNLEVAEILGRPVSSKLTPAHHETINRTCNVDDRTRLTWKMPTEQHARPMVEGIATVIRDYTIDWLREWADLRLLMREWWWTWGDLSAQIYAMACWFMGWEELFEYLAQTWTRLSPSPADAPPKLLAGFGSSAGTIVDTKKVFTEIRRRFRASEVPEVRRDIVESPLLRPFMRGRRKPPKSWT